MASRLHYEPEKQEMNGFGKDLKQGPKKEKGKANL